MASSTARHVLFPGTFDPITLGHLDVVERAAMLFERVTVGVAKNPEKRHLFDAGERAELVRRAAAGLENVGVEILEGLVVDAARSLGATLIIRGVRTGTDFDYEVSMARTNRELTGIDTILLAPSPRVTHVSSTLVRQIAAMGGPVDALVPPVVADALRSRFASGEDR